MKIKLYEHKLKNTKDKDAKIFKETKKKSNEH